MYHSRIEYNPSVQPYDDALRIGQVGCARIRLSVHSLSAAANAARILSTDYTPEIELPMLSRMVRADIAEIDRAKAIIGGAQ